MAPNRAKAGQSKGRKPSSTKPSDGKPATKSKKKSAPSPARRNAKPTAAATLKKKRRMYTEKELAIPKLNMITPAGIQKPKGKKKGKVFVDDPESMMTILAMVNADKEGQIESKIAKARQLEEIRQARQNELEARQNEKKAKFEATKDTLRRPNKRKATNDVDDEAAEPARSITVAKSSKKRVSFG